MNIRKSTLLKSVFYRLSSVGLQIAFLYFVVGQSITKTIYWSPVLLLLNLLLIGLYYAFDKGWNRLINAKVGIRFGYPNVPLPVKIRGIFQLFRPATLLPAAFVGFVGAIEVHLGWIYAILFGFMLVFMQAGGQGLNQSNEQEVRLDKLNGKTYRPTVSGILTIGEARALSYLSLVFGISIGASIGVWWLGLVMASTAVLYTQEPFYLKRFFPLNLLVQAIGRGFLPVFTLGFMTGRDTLPLAIFLCIWTFGLQSTKDFHDYSGDKELKIGTLPVLLGKRLAKYVMFAITIGDYVFALATGMWFLLIIAPLDVSSILTCEKEVKVGENSYGWYLYYISLGIGTVVGLAL